MDVRTAVEGLVNATNDVIDALNLETVKVQAIAPPPIDSSPVPSLSPTSLLVGTTRATFATIQPVVSKHPIAGVASYIYTTAKSLDIDPVFALAEAIYETGWGVSEAAQTLHNWYGYMVFANNSRSLQSFASDNEGIDTALNDMHVNYFSPSGQFFNNGSGRTLDGWATHWIAGNNINRDVTNLINIMHQLIAG